MKNQGLKLAVDKAGSVIKLAREMQICRATVYAWDERGVPLHRMFEIEKAYGINRRLLRPDLYEETAAE